MAWPDISFFQITDSGLDESSCFFVHDESGDLLPHGYYLDEWTAYLSASTLGEPTSSASLVTQQVFTGGNFTAYPNRRKVSRNLHERANLSCNGSSELTRSMLDASFMYNNHLY